MVHLLHVCCILLVSGLILNSWFILRVLHPLRTLTLQSQQLAKGDFSALEKRSGGIGEIETLRRSLLGMSRHIRHTQSQRQDYIEALTNGQEAERARLAHDLHDDTVQSLIAIGQSMDLAQVWKDQNTPQLATLLTTARQQVTETVDNLRYLIADLMPPALEELGLATALHTLEDRFTGGKLSINIHGTQRRLEEGLELTLFRCAQEALSNALRHGNATDVEIALHYQDSGICLYIKDDGAGFNVPNDISDLLTQGHYGLFSIQERVKKRKGTVRINSAIGQGTSIEIEIPFLEHQQQPTGTVRDPVCSMQLAPHQVYGSVKYEGQRYYFCCPVCQGSFQNDPDLYLQSQTQEVLSELLSADVSNAVELQIN